MSRVLLVIDVQNDVVAAAHRRDEVVATIAGLVDQARAHNVPIVWVQHEDPWLCPDTPDWQIVAQLQPLPDEARIRKQYRSSFEQTDLAQILDDADELIICGAQTNYCIRHTVHAALDRGYNVTLIGDAHTTEGSNAAGVIAEQNENLQHYDLPGRRCTVVAAADVDWNTSLT